MKRQVINFRRVVRPDIKHRPDRSDSLLDLFVTHGLNPSRMLDFHFPRHQQGANLHVGRRLLLTHLFNRGRPMLLEVGSEREQEILVERSTRSLQGTARVSSEERCRGALGRNRAPPDAKGSVVAKAYPEAVTTKRAGSSVAEDQFPMVSSGKLSMARTALRC